MKDENKEGGRKNMRQLDSVDNGTFKANMNRLCEAIDRNTKAIEKLASRSLKNAVEDWLESEWPTPTPEEIKKLEEQDRLNKEIAEAIMFGDGR